MIAGDAKGTLYLSGGDDASKTALDPYFVSDCRTALIGFIPWAMNPETRDYGAELSRTRRRLSSLGHTGGVAIACNPVELRDLMRQAGTLYIDGGNAFRLLRSFRLGGLERDISAFCEAGGRIYGDSAGAAVLGSSVETIATLDRDDVHIADRRGLSLIGETGIFVHYTPSMRAHMAKWVRRTGNPAILVPEGAAVIVTGRTCVNVGRVPASLVAGADGKSFLTGIANRGINEWT